MDNKASEIPLAEELVDNEPDESSYEFQLEKVLEEIKKICKNKPSVSLLFKGQVNENISSELTSKGYDVRFDTCYDSTKECKYNSKVRITNPKFSSSGQDFMNRIEDQVKGCAFSQANLQVSDEARNLFDTIMNSFGHKT